MFDFTTLLLNTVLTVGCKGKKLAQLQLGYSVLLNNGFSLSTRLH